MHLWLHGSISNLHSKMEPSHLYPDIYKVFQEEVSKRECYDFKWHENEDNYTVCGMSR